MAAENSDTELLTEHFGYPPVVSPRKPPILCPLMQVLTTHKQSLLDDIINAINILAEKALKSIEQYLLNQPPHKIGFRNPAAAASSKNAKNATAPGGDEHGTAPPLSTPEEAARFEIDNGTHQLETLLCSSIDKNFDLFELYVMRNILCVKPEDRDWMRLKHYEGLDLTKITSTEEEDGTDASMESVNALRRKVQASQRLNALLCAEKGRNAALLDRLRALTGRRQEGSVKREEGEESKAPLAFLRDNGALAESGGGREKPIETTTAFALSQLQALRALSTSLRNVTPDLVAVAGANTEDEKNKSWRRERKEYVEGAVKKHLENVRGLELGEQGEVRDGEWQSEGRKYSKEEVEGLERVAEGMGGGKKDPDEMDES